MAPKLTKRERAVLLLAAREAAHRNDHQLAGRLFAKLGISYVHEIQVYDPN